VLRKRRRNRPVKSCESCIVLGIVHILSNWSLETSNSSFLVPERLMTRDGKLLLSASERSRCHSVFPCPLSASQLTSHIREPVSTNAVASTVILPPSSMLRAAPKKRLGRWNAAGSIPPDKVRPLGGITRLYALASRVMLSIRTITSCLCSTKRIARSKTSSETLIWFSGTSSKLELTTSTSSYTDLSISVTSSGRSSTNKIINFDSG